MPAEERYSIQRVKDRVWVILDKTRQGGPPIGRAADENGARTIASLLTRMRGAAEREHAEATTA